jgi:hydroxymethylpyrimidine pyrophosphatase-like HAD family hydrolase
MKIIASDFDGALCENKFPQIGEPKLKVIEALKKEKENGAKIILWTCREGSMLLEAVEWCKNLGLEFDAINDNLESTVSWMGYNSRKIYATEYWDDRAVSVLSMCNAY